MLDRLIDVIVEFIERLYLFQLIQPFEQGVYTRCGKFKRVVDPGIYFTLPIFDIIFTDNVVPSTMNLPPQSLTTKDGVGCVLQAVITWQVRDIRKLILEVEGKEEVLLDSASATIGRMVNERTWAEITIPTFTDTVYEEVRKRAFRYGIEVIQVGFADMTKCRSLRLWNIQRS